MNKLAIICVDDEEIILRSLEKQLKRNIANNYYLELANNGKDALNLCQELESEGIDIALVISDQIMPEMSGDEFLIKLHAAYPKTLKILLTGKAGVDSVANVVNEASLYRYIAKPWDETDFILTVKEALRRYEQEQQLSEQNLALEKSNQLLTQSNKKLSKSLALLLATLEAANDGILVLDNQGQVVVFNQQFFTLWQINPQFTEHDINYILNLISRRVSTPIACNLQDKNTQNTASKYYILKLYNGTILESYFKIQQLEKEEVGLVWGFRDITAREREKSLVQQKALHDTLTELPKRTILTCQLAQAITQAQKNTSQLAVMFIELERLKTINETFGYQAGDRLIQQVVQRLKKCIQGEEIIARWTNDEFTLLLPQILSQQESTAIAKKILNTLKFPFSIDLKSIHVTVNIGIAVYPEHGKDADTLLKNADTAVSQAQKLGKHNYQYYNPSFYSQAHELFTIENSLYSALNNEEFTLYYQPIVNLKTGKIAKMEALLRWKNPQLGFVAPSIFIPLAEENGLIVSIGKWVMKTACAQNKAWQNMGLAPIKISVNLSVRQFQQPNLLITIENILKQTQLSPSNLELEITESVTMRDTDSTKNILKQLNQMGITLSIDDFGTGYSSLSYLKQFPFHTLKIDRSFIKDIYPGSRDIAIIQAIITLGQGLNLDIVAEGVETEELRDLLKDLGCEFIQGYLFSKPLPADEATELLQENYFD